MSEIPITPLVAPKESWWGKLTHSLKQDTSQAIYYNMDVPYPSFGHINTSNNIMTLPAGVHPASTRIGCQLLNTTIFLWFGLFLLIPVTLYYLLVAIELAIGSTFFTIEFSYWFLPYIVIGVGVIFLVVHFVLSRSCYPVRF